MRIAIAGATGNIGAHAVTVLERAGHDVVRISRSHGVDLSTGEGPTMHCPKWTRSENRWATISTSQGPS